MKTWSEQHRHECEIRAVVRMREESKERAHRYLEMVEAKRGKEAAEALKHDAIKLYSKGLYGN